MVPSNANPATRLQLDTELQARYGGRGPRYTSYPTALQFHGDFGEADYRQAVEVSQQVAVPAPLSLYVHIPFCRSLCYYCGCNKVVTRNESRVQRYLDALYAEIALQAGLFDRRRSVEQLHFGGGTPTWLTDGQLRDLLDELGRHFALDTSPRREFSIEIDPRTVTPDRAAELAAMGFNRFSLGIQDFDQHVQAAINREQSVASIEALTSSARGAGIKSVSFDLIYGLPRQSLDSFADTLAAVTDIRPDRVCVYHYAHLPERFRSQRLIDEASLPAPQEKLDILALTIETLSAAGYVYIGMDHFALPEDELSVARNSGGLQRNFQGYSTHRHCDLVGLGVSAIGQVGNAFAQNASTTGDYERLLQEGRLPVVRGLVTSADDRLRASVIQDVMCHGRIDFSTFRERFGQPFQAVFSREWPALERLADDGLVTLDNTVLEVTAQGRFLLRSVAMVFDSYLARGPQQQRFSQAV